MLAPIHTELIAPAEPRVQKPAEAPVKDFAPSLDKARRAESRASEPRQDETRGDEYGAGAASAAPENRHEPHKASAEAPAGHRDNRVGPAKAAATREGQVQRQPGNQVQVVEPRDGAHLQLSGDGTPLTEGRARDGAHLALHFKGAVITAQSAAPEPEAPAIEAAWRVFADRIKATQATATPVTEGEVVADPAPEAQVQADPAAEANQDAPEEATKLGELEAGLGNQGGDLSGGGSGGRSGEEKSFLTQKGPVFEISAQAADVRKDPSGASAGVRTRASEVAQAVREIARARIQAQQGSKSGTAQVELSINGERVVIKVKLSGGRVDVDVRGLEAGELVRLRQQLGPELERQSLQLGHVRDEEALSGDAQGQGGRRRGSEADEEADQGSVFDMAALLEGADERALGAA